MPDCQHVANNRTMLGVPLLRDGVALGSITLWKTRVEPFTEKQIELITTFADQAVIAIENARLLNELRQRTDELSKRTTDLAESLEQQTATSDVLRVISSSPVDLQSVFEAMLDNAVRICDAVVGGISRWDGEALHHVALKSAEPAFGEVIKRTPIYADPKTNIGRKLTTKTVVHVSDFAAEPAYVEQGEPGIVFAVEVGHLRTALADPMLKESELIGAILLAREEVRPFTNKQIELVKNFAAQAVIAIENARLLNELRQRTNDLTESLEQQTDTCDVLRVISSSPTDIQPVLETIGERAEKLCDAEISVVSIVDGELIRLASMHGMTESGMEAMRHRIRFNKRDIAALVERGFLPEGDCTDAEFDRAVIAMLEIIQAANLTA